MLMVPPVTGIMVTGGASMVTDKPKIELDSESPIKQSTEYTWRGVTLVNKSETGRYNRSAVPLTWTSKDSLIHSKPFE